MPVDPTDLTVISAVAAAGATAIGTLWKQTTSERERIIKKLDECESDRLALHETVGGLTSRIERLEEAREA